MTDILTTVQWIISSQDMEGNWPTKAMASWDERDSSLESNELVQYARFEHFSSSSREVTALLFVIDGVTVLLVPFSSYQLS
jgi:hypothetical protein